MNKKSTRFFSSKQEKQVAKSIGGKVVPNSGATAFQKGDLRTDDFLIEAKTCVAEKSSFSIKRQWLEKLREEAFAMNRRHYALVFNFGPDTENHYILTEKDFKLFKELLEEGQNDR